MKIRKIGGRTAALLLAVMLLFSFLTVTVCAADATPDYLALGDSISTGYGLSSHETEGFTALVAKKCGYTLSNCAVNGYTAEDIYVLIKDGSLDETIIDAELITITCGGNDMMALLYQEIADTYNASNDPDITVSDVLSGMAGTNPAVSQTALLTSAMTALTDFADSAEYEAGLKSYQAALTSVMTYIRAKNPDAAVIVNTQYNPYDSLEGVMMYNAVYSEIEAGVLKLNAVIKGNAKLLDYTVADVYSAFKASSENLGNADVSDMTAPNLDFHPNAAGHVVIAETVCAALNGTERGVIGGVNGTMRFLQNKSDVSYSFTFGTANTAVTLSDIEWTVSGTLPQGLFHTAENGVLEIKGTPSALTTFPMSVVLSATATGSDGKTYEGMATASVIVVTAYAEDLFYEAVKAIPCEVPTEHTDSAEEILAWLNGTWLPSVEASLPALDAWIDEILDSAGYVGKTPELEIVPADGAALVPAVRGTAENPNGNDGTYGPFAIVIPDVLSSGWLMYDLELLSDGVATLKAEVYHAHDYSDATCTSPAICKICGESSGESDPNNHGAEETWIRNRIEATATEDGYTGDTYCTACDGLVKTGEVIPALGSDTSDTEPSENPSTDNAGGETPDRTEPPEPEEGCGSVIEGSLALLLSVLTLPAAIVLKKRTHSKNE